MYNLVTFPVFLLILYGAISLMMGLFLAFKDVIEDPKFIDMETRITKHRFDTEWWICPYSDITLLSVIFIIIALPTAIAQITFWFPMYFVGRIIPNALKSIIIIKR